MMKNNWIDDLTSCGNETELFDHDLLIHKSVRGELIGENNDHFAFREES